LVSGILCVMAIMDLSGASAYFEAPDTGACAAVDPPAGQSGGEYWVDGSETCVTSDYITASQFQSTEDEVIAGGDEAISQPVPSDISSNDAKIGTGFWDSLEGAGDSLKGTAMDVLGKLGDWLPMEELATEPGILAVTGTAYVGWKIGSSIATFLGIDASNQTNSGGYSVTARSLCPLGQGATLGSLNFGHCVQSVIDYCPNSGGAGCTGQASLTTPVAHDEWVIDYSSGTPLRDGGCGDSAALNDTPSDAQKVITVQYSQDNFCNPYTVSGDTFVETVPMTVTSLPGPGQSMPSPLAQTISSPPITLPSEAQQKQNAAGVLSSPYYDDYTQALCHVSGSPCAAIARCTPDPLGGAVTVPSILDGESVTDYEQCLSHLGLSNSVSTLQQTDVEQPDGDVALVSPEEGTQVEPGSSVTIEPNPTKPDMQTDQRCRPSDTPAAGYPSGDAPAFQDFSGPGFVGSPYPGIDPRTTPPSNTSIHLYWGYVPAGTEGGWGYRHIANRHGYGPTDEKQTMLALAGPFYYQDAPTTWVFDYPYTVTMPDLSTVSCERRVVVQYQQFDSEPAAKGIITSYYGTPLGSLP
jgi:hypothetical protein